MESISWLLAFLGALVGGVILLGSLSASSAPQQGAGAAVAVACAVIPYVIARAFSHDRERRDRKRMVELLEALNRKESQV